MFEWLKAGVLRWMKVPHEPEPPLGAPGSVRVFRAGLNHYRLRVLRWALGQVGAVVGIGFSLFFLGAMQVGMEQVSQVSASPTPAVQETPDPASVANPGPAEVEGAGGSASGPTRARSRSGAERRRSAERAMATLVARTPPYVVPLIELLELAALAFLFAQMFISFAIVRLEFEQHWYIVTDRSLRIRTGILRLQESTMSFANIQQVELKQGPLQRLLGLADIYVRSAGGGDSGASPQGHRQEPSLHVGIFEGVANAVQIRDLILERLRKFREAGLGDPEDRRTPSPVRSAGSLSEAVAELLVESRSLSRVLRANSDGARILPR